MALYVIDLCRVDDDKTQLVCSSLDWACFLYNSFSVGDYLSHKQLSVIDSVCRPGVIIDAQDINE